MESAFDASINTAFEPRFSSLLTCCFVSRKVSEQPTSVVPTSSSLYITSGGHHGDRIAIEAGKPPVSLTVAAEGAGGHFNPPSAALISRQRCESKSRRRPPVSKRQDQRVPQASATFSQRIPLCSSSTSPKGRRGRPGLIDIRRECRSEMLSRRPFSSAQLSRPPTATLCRGAYHLPQYSSNSASAGPVAM